MTENSSPKDMSRPPAPELKRLDVLVGHWRSAGQTLATPSSPSITIRGTDTYEWMPGGFFLIHRVKVKMGDEQVDTLEIIGDYDEANQTYPMRSFDNMGRFETMQASVNEQGIWTFAGESARATLKIGDDGRSMSAHWEQTSDSIYWLPWMDMTFTKDDDTL